MRSDRNVGPVGGLAASANARRRIVPSSPRLRTSWAHFDGRRGEVGERARQQRVVGEVALVLLAGGDDQRRAVGAWRW